MTARQIERAAWHASPVGRRALREAQRDPKPLPQAAHDTVQQIFNWLGSMRMDELHACAAYALCVNPDLSYEREATVHPMLTGDKTTIIQWNARLNILELVRKGVVEMNDTSMAGGDLIISNADLRQRALHAVAHNAAIAIAHEYRFPDAPGADDLSAAYYLTRKFHTEYRDCTRAQRRAVHQLLESCSGEQAANAIAAIKASELA